jgi:transposase-like protein
MPIFGIRIQEAAMDRWDFQKLLVVVEKLSPRQRERLSAALNAKQVSGEASQVAAERVCNAASCPSCGSISAGRWGHRHGLQRYRCRDCHRTFNALSGTPVARLRKKETWPVFAGCLVEGRTVRDSAEACGVHPNTTFRWRHRFLEGAQELKAEHLEGIVEADETFFLESQKGRRKGLIRKPRKRGGTASTRGRSKELACVLVARDRAGATTDAVCGQFNQEALSEAIQRRIEPDSVLCSDGLPVYKAFARMAGLAHKPVNLSEGIRVVEGVFHIQNVNAYHHRLKEWIRHFHGVATKYLPNYLGWYRLLDARGKRLPPKTFLRAAIGLEHYQPLTVT